MNGFAFARFSGDHAIQIEQKNQAPVRSDSGAGEKFYAAEIFAEALDHDFVFAENFFDDDANLTIVSVGDDHAEVAVDRFERRKAEIRVEANDFSDHIANFCEQLSANIFNLVGTKPANLFYNREWQREIRGAATHEESGRDNER